MVLQNDYGLVLVSTNYNVYNEVDGFRKLRKSKPLVLIIEWLILNKFKFYIVKWSIKRVLEKKNSSFLVKFVSKIMKKKYIRNEEHVWL